MTEARQKFACFAALGMMLVGAGALAWLNTHHKLGIPAVRTTPLPNSSNLQVELPENVLDYQSTNLPIQKLVLDFLPPDTSYGSRGYIAPDKFQVLANVVLMGADRTSLHKPQFCLEGQGWRLDSAPSSPETITVMRPTRYELPVIKLTASREVTEGGQKRLYRAVYVYWYVADGEMSASTTGFDRMWLMARDLIKSGVLQRWAYISYFAVCNPGEESAAFGRMKELIAASVPEFQLMPRQNSVSGSPQNAAITPCLTAIGL
jgi:hypothetical protein